MKNKNKFIICKKMLKNEFKNVISLVDGYFLNYNDMKVEVNADRTVVLLGHAWQATSGAVSPSEYVRSAEANDVASILREEMGWVGRYTLIVGSSVYLDYGGQMGAFISDHAVSNSLRVLRQYNSLDFVNPKLTHDLSPDFMLGAYTMYPEIQRLLPGQRFDYRENRVYERSIFPENPFEDMNTDEIYETFESLFISSLRNMVKEFPDSDIALALSGGYDSRTAFALLCASGVNFRAFTLEHPKITRGDIDLPKRLSSRMGIHHDYIPRRKSDHDSHREKQFDEENEYLVVDEDRGFYAYGQYQQVKKDKPILILRSGLWATIREPYFNDSIPVNRERFRKLYPALALDERRMASFDSYMDYMEHGELNRDVDPQDRMYLEIRVGCWRADIENSFDMMDGIESVDPVNSRMLMVLLRMLDHEEKEGKKHEIRITREVCPEISDIPYEHDYQKNALVSRVGRAIRWRARAFMFVLRQYGVQGLNRYRQALRKK